MNYTAKLSAKRVSRSAWGNFLVAVFLLLLGAFTILPIYYSIVSSLKPLNELFLYPPRFFVYHPTLRNFSALIKLQAQSPVPFERYLFNSVFGRGDFHRGVCAGGLHGGLPAGQAPGFP